MGAGLWSQRITLIGSRFTDKWFIALIVFALLTFICIFVIYCNQRKVYYLGDDAALRKVAFKGLRVSTLQLLLCYLIRIVDIFLNEFSVKVPQGYFFTYVFAFSMLSIQADFMILAVVCRMTYYQYPLFGAKKVAEICTLIFEGLLVIMVALYAFQLALYVAYWTLYLNSVQLWTVSNVLLQYTRVITSFELVYFILSLFVFASTIFVLARNFGEGLSSLEKRFLFIVALLLLRSSTEAIIAVRYDLLDYTSPHYLRTIREMLYGLPSIGIYYYITQQSYPTIAYATTSDVLRDCRSNVKKEFMRKRVEAANGGPGYPTAAETLKELELRPFASFSAEGVGKMALWGDDQIRTMMERHVQDVLSVRAKVGRMSSSEVNEKKTALNTILGWFSSIPKTVSNPQVSSFSAKPFMSVVVQVKEIFKK